MDEKIIGLKVRLVGQEDMLKGVDEFNDRLEISAKALQEIEQVGKGFTKTTRRINASTKALDSYIEKLKEIDKESTTQSKKRDNEGNKEETRRAKATKSLIKQAEELKKQGKNYDDLVDSIARNRLERQKLNKEIRDQQNQFASVDQGIGEYKRLSAEFAVARERAKDLQAEYRRLGKEFDETVDEAIADALRLNNKLKEIDGNIGNFGRNVGNYPATVGSALQSLFPLFGQVNEGIDGIANTATKTGKAIATSFFILTLIQALFEGAKALDEFARKFNEVRNQTEIVTGAVGDDLDVVASKVVAISEVFDQDYNEVLKASNVLSRQFGITQEEALEKIATGFENNLDRSNDFLDNIQEYSVQFATAEASADEFFGVLGQSVEQGVFSDKGPDLVKEFGLRIREQATATEEALQNAFGNQFTEDLFEGINDGSISTIDALKLVSSELNNVETNTQQTQQLIADVFGSPGEDAGESFIRSLENINSNLDDTIAGFNEYQQEQRRLRQANEELALSQVQLSESFEGTQNALRIFGVQVKTVFFQFVAAAVDGIKLVPAFTRATVVAIGFLVKQVDSFFDRIQISLEIAGRQIAKANPFGKTNAEINEEIKLLRERRDAIKANTVSAGQAFNEVLKEENRKRKIREEVAAQEKKRQEDLAATAEQEQMLDEKRRQIAAAQLERIKKAAKEREEAAKNIMRLEEELIQNRFDRQARSATNSANSDTASLVGSPEQIRQQTILIQQQLQKQLIVIERARNEAQTKALEQAKRFSQELVRITASNELAGVTGQNEGIEQGFRLDEQRIQNVFEQNRAALLVELEKNEVTYAEYNKRLENATRLRDEGILELEQRTAVSQLEILTDLTEKRIEKLRADFEVEKEILIEQRRQRDQAISGNFDEGNITEAERDQSLSDSRELLRQQELEHIQDFESQKLALLNETAVKSIAIQKDVTQKENALRKESLGELRDYQRQQERILDQTNEALGRAIGDLFTGQIASVKDFNKEVLLILLDAVEKQAILAIASASVQSLAQADSVTTFGITGGIRAVILAGLIKAATSGLKAAIRSFEDGGTLDFGMSNGIELGKTHHDGGVRYGMNEIQHGEFKLRNGHKTHIINRQSTNKFKPELFALSKNVPSAVYSPAREAMASNINAFRGWGRMFRDGGTILNAPSLNAPVPQSNNNLTLDLSPIEAQGELSTQLIQEVMEAVKATNKRIDRITVINRPDETITAGNEILELENEISL